MEAKRVVYVSSTFVDLEAHRAELRQALEKARYDVSSMEGYPAFDERPLDNCLADVAAADVYVLLIAYRYGYRPSTDNPGRRSITELEYEQALASGKSCLVFTVDPEHDWKPKWIDKGTDATSLEAFKARVEERHGVNRFTDPGQLTGLVLAALSSLASRSPASEWKRDTRHNLPVIPLDPLEWPGRHDDLRCLGELLAEPGPAVVIRGMDGVGKSSLALRAAHGLRPGGQWQAIVCLEAREGEGAVAQQLLNFAATRLDLSPPEEHDLGARLSWCLEHWPDAPAPVLLLLDDLIDAEALQGLATGLPDRFRLLITTRLRLDSAIRELELHHLLVEDAVRLLEQRSGRGSFAGAEHQAAEALAAEVGQLPLALTLLARQLRRDADLSLATLARRLAEQGGTAEVLQQAAPELLVKRGLKAGFDLILAELAPGPRELALTLGTLAEAIVPLPLLSHCAPAAMAEEAWEGARSELINRSLLERPQSGTYRLHPLLHDLLAAAGQREVEAQAQRQQRLAAAVAAWARQLPVVMDAAQREQWLTCLPQLEQAAAWPIEAFAPGDACWPALALGRFHSAQGLYDLAVPWLRRALERVDNEGATGKADRATCLEALAGIGRERGEFAEAEADYREALALREAEGPDHLDVAEALNGLGLLLHDRGESQAEGVLRRALALRQRALPAEDDRVITSLNNLGKELVLRGKEEEALRLYGEALAAAGDRVSVLVVSLHNNMAWLHHCAGRGKQALQHQEQAVNLAEAAQGENHPDRGLFLMNLAILEDGEGQAQAAEAHYRQALHILETSWGEEHPHSQDCRLYLETFLAERKRSRRTKPRSDPGHTGAHSEA